MRLSLVSFVSLVSLTSALAAGSAAAEQARKAAPPPPPKKVLKQPAITPAIAARLPDSRLVSYQGKDGLVVARITKKGPVELLRKELEGTSVWVDARTMVVVNPDLEGGVEVDFVVDGALDAKRHLSHKKEAWALKKTESPLSHTLYKVDKELWVEACLEENPGAQFCKKVTYLRVDATPAKPSRTKPAKAVRVSEIRTTPPDIKAPAGHSVKIAKAKGTTDSPNGETAVDCVATSGKKAWKVTNDGGAGGFAGKAVRWVLATPAVFGIDGVETNPVGWEENVTKYFRACAEAPLEGFAWIGDGVWSSEDWSADVITVRVDDTPAIVFDGARLEVAPK